MNRNWLAIAMGVAAGLAVIVARADSDLAHNPAVQGEAVDGDIPATYRLPSVKSTPVEQPIAEAMPNWQSATKSHAATAPLTTTVNDQIQQDAVDAAPTTGSSEAFPKVYEIARREVTRNTQADIAPINTIAYTPTTAELTSQLLPAVQRGFGLAKRGALYAARTEFVQVLRRVAQAQDAASHTTEHSRALAEGLRALDEADDFVPDGTQLEAELDVRIVASSHRTDVLPENGEVSTFEAVALYHAFAEQQLAKAMAGEQAGSMALHGLGLVYARLAERNDNDLQFNRSAMSMYSAALSTCPNNHLAANELGVLSFRAGRADEAAGLFEQTIDFAPTAAAYHNLAMAQRKLGFQGPAAANEAESQRLAMVERQRGDVSRRTGVHWVTPAEMARSTRPGESMPADAAPQPGETPEKSAWQRTVEFTKKSLPGSDDDGKSLGPMTGTRLARPTGTTQKTNESRWR